MIIGFDPESKPTNSSVERKGKAKNGYRLVTHYGSHFNTARTRPDQCSISCLFTPPLATKGAVGYN